MAKDGRPMGLDITIADMMDDEIQRSAIAEFFENKNILISGCTGFMGQLLIEKLLRSCTKLNKLYLLIRPKKQKTADERFKEFVGGVLFDRLKREVPNYESKIVCVNSDVAEEGLGLSPEDRKILIDNINVVFHSAATVKFDEKLSLATRINVRGTRDLIYLAQEMKGLNAFVHISTAYSNCTANCQNIDEKFYEPPIDYKRLLYLTEYEYESKLDFMTPDIVGKWPNTYTLTKLVAEDLVKDLGKGLPITIVRPSIIVATAREPIPGWINNLYGVTGVIMGAALGILRSLHCNKDTQIDMVPADMVTNACITSAWDIATNKKPVGTSKGNEIPIFNYVSTSQNPHTFKDVMKYTETTGFDIPSKRCVWYYWFTLNKNYYVHLLYIILFQFMPAAIIDFFLLISGRKPVVWNIYKKVHKFSSILDFFTNSQWYFSNKNTQELCKKQNSADKELFDFDIAKIDWPEYYISYIRGLRVYLVKDPIDTVAEGKVKYTRLKYLHYTVLPLYLLFVYKVFSMLIFGILGLIF